VVGLVGAIRRAESRPDRAATASALAARSSWNHVFELELADLKALSPRRPRP
jgi:hypothetical protein